MADIKNLLQRAQDEILMLRRSNEVLRAKVETMDLADPAPHTSSK